MSQLQLLRNLLRKCYIRALEMQAQNRCKHHAVDADYRRKLFTQTTFYKWNKLQLYCCAQEITMEMHLKVQTNSKHPNRA